MFSIVIPIFHCKHVNGVIKKTNGTAQGTYGSYYLFTVLLSQDGYAAWSTAYTYSTSVMIDDGGRSGGVINGVSLGAFTSSTTTSTGFKGNFG